MFFFARCTASASLHAVVQFVASERADRVNFVLNTSYLISEVSGLFLFVFNSKPCFVCSATTNMTL